MNAQELQKEIILDLGNVVGKVPHLVPSIRRKMYKRKEKKFTETVEYMSPKKNLWHIRITVNKKNPELVETAQQIYLPLTEEIYQPYMIDGMGGHGLWMGLGSIEHITRHCLRRYRERFLKDETIPLDRVAKRILKNGENGIHIDDKKVLLDNVDGIQFETTKTFFKTIEDGIQFGSVEKIEGKHLIFHNATFITYDMIYDDQADMTIKLAAAMKDFKEEYFEQIEQLYKTNKK